MEHLIGMQLHLRHPLVESSSSSTGAVDTPSATSSSAGAETTGPGGTSTSANMPSIPRPSSPDSPDGASESPGTAGPPSSGGSSKASGNLGAIVGGAVGGVVLLALITILALVRVLRRCRQQRHRRAREAALATAALDWQKTSMTCSLPSETASMDASTIKAYDGESELQTLEGDDLSEKNFGQYQGTLDCESTAPVGQYSGPTFGVDIPSWAYQQLTGSDAFDVTKAQEVARDPPPGGASPSSASTQVPQPTSAPTPSTPSEPPQPTVPSAQTSEGFPSSSSLSSVSVSQSGPDTASGGQPMTSSLPGGAPGAVNASSTNPLENGPGSPTATLGEGASSGEYTGAGASPTDRHPPPSGHEAVSAELGVTGSHVASPSSPGATFATSSPSALGATSSASQVGPIVGGVIGAIVIVILALVVALLLLRRRREHRYRHKQAELAQAAFEWDKGPGAYLTPASMEPDALEPATATTDDGASEAETLHGDDEFIEKNFPEALPPDTPIPSWAYIPLTSGGNFDLTEAEAVAEGYSGFVSSGSKDPTQSLPGTTTGQSPATASPDGTQLPDGLITIVNSATVTSVLRESATVTSSQTQTTSPSPSSRKTGYPNAVIAGAVSAALLTLLAIGVGSLFFFRRRRRRRHHRRHRIARTASRLRRTKGQTSVQPPPTSKEDLLVDIPSPGSPLKLYDPDDPSTYPPPLSEIARVAPNMAAPHMCLMLEQPEGNKKPLDSKDLQISFGQYSGQLDCENTAPVGQYSGPTFGVDIPSWAYQQLTASDTFDFLTNPNYRGSSSWWSKSITCEHTGFPTYKYAYAVNTFGPISTNGITSANQRGIFFVITIPTVNSSPGGGPGAVNASSTNPLENGSPTATFGDGASSGANAGAGASPTDNLPPPSGQEAVPTELGGTDSHVASPSSQGATFATTSPSMLGTVSSAKRIRPVVGGVIGGVVVVILAFVVSLLLLRRRRGAASVSPFRRASGQVSIASVAPAPFALSAASRPPSLVFSLHSSEGRLVDTSSPITRMRLDDPDDPSTYYPPSHSDIAPSKTWSDSSLPPYSP
ncbi:hypothetical protein ACG7TL_003493 [Trametes sanguinea]